MLPNGAAGFAATIHLRKAARDPERWWDVGTTAPAQGQGFGDTASLEFTGECPTASAWDGARAFPQILRDLPAAEGKAALPACIICRGDSRQPLLNGGTNASHGRSQQLRLGPQLSQLTLSRSLSPFAARLLSQGAARGTAALSEAGTLPGEASSSFGEL